MRLGTAIECLVDNYKCASDKEWINDKVAWALYHTWKEADRKTEKSSEKPNNCEPQKRCDECIHFDRPYTKRDKDGMLIIGVECDGMDEPCDKWTDEPQTE